MDAVGVLLMLLLLAAICWLIGKVLLFAYRTIQSLCRGPKSKLPPRQNTPSGSASITTEEEPTKAGSVSSYEQLSVDYFSAYERLRINHSDNLEWFFCQKTTMKLADYLYGEKSLQEALTYYFETCYIHLNSPKPRWIESSRGSVTSSEVTQVPHSAVARIRGIAKRLHFSNRVLHTIFITHNAKIQTTTIPLMPLSPEACWPELEIAIANDPPGYYDGNHFTHYVDQVKDLKRDNQLEQAAELLLHLTHATKSEAQLDDSAEAPWYEEQLGIVYRKMAREHRSNKDYGREAETLQRYLERFPGDTKMQDRLKELRDSQFTGGITSDKPIKTQAFVRITSPSSLQEATTRNVSQALEQEDKDPDFTTVVITAKQLSTKGKARFQLADNYEGYVEQIALHHLSQEGWEGFWGENKVWSTLMALLFWDVLFAKIDGVWEPLFGTFPSTHQDMPKDLFKPDFFPKREALITAHLNALASADLSLLLNRSYEDNYGKPCRPIENWDRFCLADLQNVIAHLPKSQLLAIMLRMLKDFSSNRSGLPDLFVWNSSGRAFVEVKGPHDQLSSGQVAWLKALKEIGEVVFILRIQKA